MVEYFRLLRPHNTPRPRRVFLGACASAMIPLLRLAVRYAPVSREKLWPLVLRYFAWRRHDFTARTISGDTFTGNTSDLIQRFIYYFGFWDPHVEDAMRRWLRPGDVFVDVGANIGYFSLTAARIVGPSGKVIAVEACPSTFAALQANVQRNGYRNVRCVNVAAHDHSGSITIYSGKDGNIGSASLMRAYGHAEIVPCAPLTEILTAEELTRARFIKIELEGAEAAVLHGIDTAKLPQDGCLLVEANPESMGELTALFPGWRIYGIDPPGGNGQMGAYFHQTAHRFREIQRVTMAEDVLVTRSA
jgi:FkbM family methyltransferase